LLVIVGECGVDHIGGTALADEPLSASLGISQLIGAYLRVDKCHVSPFCSVLVRNRPTLVHSDHLREPVRMMHRTAMMK
jgi:hypothetical protein